MLEQMDAHGRAQRSRKSNVGQENCFMKLKSAFHAGQAFHLDVCKPVYGPYFHFRSGFEKKLWKDLPSNS